MCAGKGRITVVLTLDDARTLEEVCHPPVWSNPFSKPLGDLLKWVNGNLGPGSGQISGVAGPYTHTIVPSNHSFNAIITRNP